MIFSFVMPGLFRHPLRGAKPAAASRAARWTPDQVRGDEGRRSRHLGFLLAALLATPALAAPIPGAHRGRVPGVAENSLPAIRAAARAGAAVIEMDVRTTFDGQFVILHDDTVDRTTDGHGRLGRLTAWQVRRLRSLAAAGAAGERVPTLAQALREIRGTRAKLLLDVKSAPMPRLIDEIRWLKAQDRVILGLRSPAEVVEAKALAPAIPRLAFVGKEAEVPVFVAAGADIVRLWSDWLVQPDGAAKVAAVHAAGRQAWGLVGQKLPADTPGWQALHAQVAATGVDGLVTDRPDLLEK